MTVTHASTGTPTSATGSATAPAPVFPATVTLNQKAVLCVNMKPFSATMTTPAGWTLIGSSTNGSVASGANVGSTKGYAFEKICDGTEDGTTVTLAVTSADSAGAVISLLDTDESAWASTVVAWGNKVGNSANMAMTTTTQTSVAAGDLMVEFFSINSSAGTPSADTLTQTGVTYGAVTNRADRSITTGNDSRLRVNTVPVTSVTTPSGGAAGGYTNASATSGLLGVIRFRDATSQLPASGTVDGVSATSGDTTLLAVAAGQVDAVTSVSGAATVAAGAVQYPAAGTVAGTTAVTGAITKLLSPGSGTVAGVSAVTGAAASRLVSSGSIAAVTAATGATTARRVASGSAAVISAVSGVTTARFPSTGSVAAVTAVSASVTALRPSSGTVAAVTTVSGETKMFWITSGSVDGVTALTGAVLVRSPASGEVEVISSISAEMFLRAKASGVVDAISGVFGTITTEHTHFAVWNGVIFVPMDTFEWDGTTLQPRTPFIST